MKCELDKVDRIAIYIKSKKDAKKWKMFLSYYFPNHYAKRILNTSMVNKPNPITRIYKTRPISVTKDGYGYITLMLAYYGKAKFINDFNDFTKTKVYNDIISNGPIYEEGEPEVIEIK